MSDADWVKDNDKKMIIADSEGNIVCVWHEHYENGIPVNPPIQHYESRREVISESLDLPVNWKEVIKGKGLRIRNLTPSGFKVEEKP